MEDHLSQLAPVDGWGNEFAAALQEQQSRARAFLGAQRARLDEIESDLARQVERVAHELEQDSRRIEDERDATRRQNEDLQRGREELARLRQELESARDAWEQSQQATHQQQQQLAHELNRRQGELDARSCELAETETRLRQQQRQLADERAEFEAATDELKAARTRLDDKSAQLEREREELEHEQAETKGQRRRIAHELRQQKTTLDAELKKQQAELEANQKDLESRNNELDKLADTLQQRAVELQQQFAEREAKFAEREAEIVDLRRQLEETGPAAAGDPQLEERLQQLTADCHGAREARTRLEAELASTRARLEAAEAAQHEIESRCASLNERLADADRRLAAASTAVANDAQVADMQRRHEMLLEDLREQKKRNQKLEHEIEGLKSGRLTATQIEGNDWESQKRRLLAALEAEAAADDNPDRKQERLSIEETIRKTETVVAAKEHEINELQRLLEQQSSQVGNLAVGAAAIAAELDKDELIQHEREKLNRMQDEWREKLRQAEIDLSLERAKIARERAELEEKLRQTEDERARHPEAGEVDPTGKKPATRGKWLARLGLKDDEASSGT
ncbi:MAG: hypothetical protein KF708_20140 [Pirellulales bacterium]|nr:hypothetical protein [Pirellulales bacterium]